MRMKHVDLEKTRKLLKKISKMLKSGTFQNVTNLKKTVLFKNLHNQNKIVKQLRFLEGTNQPRISLCKVGPTNFLKREKNKLEILPPKVQNFYKGVRFPELSRLSPEKKFQRNLTKKQKTKPDKNEKCYECVGFPELNINYLPPVRKFQRSLTTVCHGNREFVNAGKSNQNLRKAEHEKCDFVDTFLTRMVMSHSESDPVITKQKNSFNREELFAKKPVNDKRFCDLEAKLQPYRVNNSSQTSQRSYIPSVVHLYRQKMGFTWCSK